MHKSFRSLLALAALSAAAFAMAPAVASPPSHPTANPMETQSVFTVQKQDIAAAHAVKIAQPAQGLHFMNAFYVDGLGLSASHMGLKVSSVHPGCDGRESHPSMKKGSKGKGGGGKKCIDASAIGALPRST